MDLELLDIIKNELAEGRKVCHAMIIEQEGTSPRSIGTSMVIKENGEIFGTVGGGIAEFKTITAAKRCMKEEISETISLNVQASANETDACTDKLKVFIKTYAPQNKLIIAGAGHVAHCLYKFACETGFSVYILDHREELLTKEKFPMASKLVLGRIPDTIRDCDLDKTSYIVIASGTHQSDEDILREIMIKNPEVAYIGMLGSKKKVSIIMNNLMEQNIDEESLKKVYAPIGLGIGGETPEEVALSILAEIILIKNNGVLKHMSIHKES